MAEPMNCPEPPQHPAGCQGWTQPLHCGLGRSPAALRPRVHTTHGGLERPPLELGHGAYELLLGKGEAEMLPVGFASRVIPEPRWGGGGRYGLLQPALSLLAVAQLPCTESPVSCAGVTAQLWVVLQDEGPAPLLRPRLSLRFTQCNVRVLWCHPAPCCLRRSPPPTLAERGCRCIPAHPKDNFIKH